ncbi:MAG: hypothetical protein DME32_15535 [Verrucomicrobia bacterium]|nr:MAG: hypothetical protein DME32_15535 [Verrucomicrobiota bacterium]
MLIDREFTEPRDSFRLWRRGLRIEQKLEKLGRARATAGSIFATSFALATTRQESYDVTGRHDPLCAAVV